MHLKTANEQKTCVVCCHNFHSRFYPSVPRSKGSGHPATAAQGWSFPAETSPCPICCQSPAPVPLRRAGPDSAGLLVVACWPASVAGGVPVMCCRSPCGCPAVRVLRRGCCGFVLVMWRARDTPPPPPGIVPSVSVIYSYHLVSVRDTGLCVESRDGRDGSLAVAWTRFFFSRGAEYILHFSSQ